MDKAPLVITATTPGRAKYRPGYETQEYYEEGDIPNHIAATLAFIRQELGPNEKVVVVKGKFSIVEKTVLDKVLEKLGVLWM